MQVFSHTLKDNYSPRNTIPNQRSYISDFKVETKSNKYPVVSLIVVPLDIKKLIDYAFDNDEEGVVLTLKNAIVNPGTRTAWKTLKIKKELQNQFVM